MQGRRVWSQADNKLEYWLTALYSILHSKTGNDVPTCTLCISRVWCQMFGEMGLLGVRTFSGEIILLCVVHNTCIKQFLIVVLTCTCIVHYNIIVSSERLLRNSSILRVALQNWYEEYHPLTVTLYSRLSSRFCF